jgi:hypothetical protein
MFRILAALVLLLSLAPTLQAEDTPAKHPLLPLLELTEQRLRSLDAVQDYTCTVVKRERIEGRLQEAQTMFVKLRQEQARGGQVMVPLAVYIRYLSPTELEGREVIYVQGANGGKMIVRKGGPRFAHVTVAVAPDAPAAFRDNNHPITEIGFRSMLLQLLRYGREDLNYGECEVKYYTGAKINGRVATVAEIVHPVRRSHFQYHKAQVFIDDQLQLPVRFVVYDWPAQDGGNPPLIEEFTVVDIKLNVGLADAEFDHRNPDYHFSKSFRPEGLASHQ